MIVRRGQKYVKTPWCTRVFSVVVEKAQVGYVMIEVEPTDLEKILKREPDLVGIPFQYAVIDRAKKSARVAMFPRPSSRMDVQISYWERMKHA